MNIKKVIFLLILVFLPLLFGSCIPNWNIVVSTQEGEFLIDRQMIDDYQILKESEVDCGGIPLEIILYQNGINTIEKIEIESSDQIAHSYKWKEIAEEACITTKGEIIVEGEGVRSELITVTPGNYDDLDYSLLDIFPTVLSSLNIDYLTSSYSRPLVEIKTNHVALIFLDGLNYFHFDEAIKDGSLTVFNNPLFYSPALTIFPPRTSTASAAIITGKLPITNGVFKSGIRLTQEKTLFNIVVENGYTAVSVEGESLPFNLHGSEIILSGDKDLNGGTDDNVYANVFSFMKNEVPNLFYIHFHGIDDLGHTYGPSSQEVKDKVNEINGYLNEIIQKLPEDTLVITFADHGMHDVISEKDRGNHGNLIEEDMIVFINISIK